MTLALEHGLIFPAPVKTENVEAEARVMLSWLKEGRYWVHLSGKDETSTRGRLLLLLPNTKDVTLRVDIEETLKRNLRTKYTATNQISNILLVDLIIHR